MNKNFAKHLSGVLEGMEYSKAMQILDCLVDRPAAQVHDIEELEGNEQYAIRFETMIKKKLKQKVKKLQLKYAVDRDVIEESIAKQYLKMICSCIYKKVDEKDDNKKEIAYKSFWALASYLEEKGVTGYIYPCTRTNKVIGKNLVLFNKHDAEPMESTIRKFVY